MTATNGTGYTTIGARVANVGAGGFSLGGGISFLGNAYGVASDNLVQLEYVLPSGKVVNATKCNEYSDLFWASQGGGGQFGIVTRFWQEAVPEPKESTLAFYYINDDDVARLREQTVDFFNNNKDPFSLVYYSFGYLSNNLANPTPETFAKRTLLITVHFDDPASPYQLDYNATFANLFSGINISASVITTTPHYSDLVFLGEAAFPYGFRRGFYGAQTTEIDVKYIADISDIFFAHIDELIARDDIPYSASFVLQYVFPGLNGNTPSSDSDTAWPHATVGHQNLFAPAYLNADNDDLVLDVSRALDRIAYDRQAELGEFLGNYPNYISPLASGRRIWGDNVARLIKIKGKYDPDCLIRSGRVFASRRCVVGGWANVFDS